MRFLTLISLLLFTIGLSAQQADCGCCTSTHEAFDFWIGEWEVFQPDGQLVGTNTIIKEQQGCMLRENWVSSNTGFTGTSSNFYNQIKGRWEQLWIDNSGSYLHLYGNRVGDQMILLSEAIPREQKGSYVNRITWTANADGTVRQLWEILVNDEVEKVVFDGLYKRKS